MEVSVDLKEDVRKIQTELKNAIKIHQVWVARLQDDENNTHLKYKVREAEKEIIIVGQNQKIIIGRLRKELELYQQRLKARNKQVDTENDHRYVALQLREHLGIHKRRNSLLKPSNFNEKHLSNGDKSIDVSDSNFGNKGQEKENFVVEDVQKIVYTRQVSNGADKKDIEMEQEWPEHDQCSESGSMPAVEEDMSPSPSPPPLNEREPVTQERFLRLVDLITPQYKEIVVKKRNERRKRSTVSTNKKEFLYENFENNAKRKKLSQYPYLQPHNDPPQTRSAKLKKQKDQPKPPEKLSREGSPSSTETKTSVVNWQPEDEDSQEASQRTCHGCGRNDVRSLLVRCVCGVSWHTGCADGVCAECEAPLPDPTHLNTGSVTQLSYEEKLSERKRLQEKNIQLCHELRKLEIRAASLKDNLDDQQAEKRKLLADQIKTQRNLQKLLDFISQFKETSISVKSTSLSESSSEMSKSNDEQAD